MDSLTQIVLGAAVGEAVLGKKIGNRAMFWGAVGGTIPDMDVVLGPFISEVDALVVHRGFSHSLVFALIGSVLFGWLVYQLYKSPYYKWIAVVGWAIFLLLIAALLISIGMGGESLILAGLVGTTLLGAGFFWLRKRYFRDEAFYSDTTLREWCLLFFLALLTHPVLDAFTMYGTQLFWPFSSYRVAFSTISVADPVYTIPFIICLVTAAFMSKGSLRRKHWNRAGLIISSVYLLFTVVNKQYINRVFERSLAEQEIIYSRCITGPTILNNILWSATVETDSVYYQGTYSWFDQSPVVFSPIEKNHELASGPLNDRTMRILKWFTKGFYNVIIRKDGRMQVNDLRYGTFNDHDRGENDYVFRFIIERNKEGGFEVKKADGGPPPGTENSMLESLIERIKGR